MPRSPLTADLVSRPSAASAACASGTRAGTQGKKREAQRAAVHRVAPGSRVSLRSPGTRGIGGARSEPLAAVSTHDVKQRSLLRSRSAFMRPGLSFCSPRPWPELRCRARRSLGGNPGTSSPISPRPRGGWSADRALFCFVARARRDLRALRRGLSRSERDLSRRSTMAIFGRGPMPPPPGV
jgi:hypothetical protein